MESFSSPLRVLGVSGGVSRWAVQKPIESSFQDSFSVSLPSPGETHVTNFGSVQQGQVCVCVCVHVHACACVRACVFSPNAFAGVFVLLLVRACTILGLLIMAAPLQLQLLL